MISEVVMPQMGADMTEGTIVRWIKSEGDPVNRGEIIAEIETDKANVEIEAFESGVFRKVLAQEGDTIGGLVFNRLGYLPKAGAKIELPRLAVTVRRTSRKRIEELLLEKTTCLEDEPEDNTAAA